MSLEAHAVQAALDAEVTGTKLISNYTSEEQQFEQIAVSRGVPREDAWKPTMRASKKGKKQTFLQSFASTYSSCRRSQ